MKKRRLKNPSGIRLLTLQQIQDLTGMSQATVYRWVYRDKLPTYRSPSGRHLVREEDLTRFLAEHYGP